MKRFTVLQNELMSYELNEKSCKEVTKYYLEQMLGNGNFVRVENGKSVVKITDEDFHGSLSESYVRDATELDQAISVVLKALNGEK